MEAKLTCGTKLHTRTPSKSTDVLRFAFQAAMGRVTLEVREGGAQADPGRSYEACGRVPEVARRRIPQATHLHFHPFSVISKSFRLPRISPDFPSTTASTAASTAASTGAGRGWAFTCCLRTLQSLTDFELF